MDILKACLEQVDEWEPKVHAWVVLDRDRAMEQARALDEELRAGKDRGPLHGIPIGIKDIIAVQGIADRLRREAVGGSDRPRRMPGSSRGFARPAR